MPIGKLKCMSCGEQAEKIKQVDLGNGVIANIPTCFACFWMSDDEVKQIVVRGKVVNETEG